MRESIINGHKFAEIEEIVKNSYIGEIVSTAGIEQSPGRVKIRVYGIYGEDNSDLGKIPDADLPYAYPLFGNGFGSKTGGEIYSAPKVGTKVRVVFKDDIYHPRYYAPENLTEALQQEIANDPVNFKSLIYDEDEKIRMYYTQKTGFLLEFDESLINIKPDNSILINHKGSSSTIELRGADIDITTNNSVNISAPNNITENTQTCHINTGQETLLGNNPSFSALLAEPTIILLKALATIINNKLPIDTTALELVNQMESQIKSTHVKLTYK